MKAAVYFGARDIRCEDVKIPEIGAPHEVLVKVTATSICGSDLHVYRGSLEALMENGRSRTGHELIGTIVECGNQVKNFREGDRVTMAYSCSCGSCYMCELGQTAHCETTQKAVYGFGTPFGDLNGTHAEYMLLPFADGHVMKVPESISDAAAVTLSCSLPSAIVANHLADIRPGENVAVIGCGPTGLLALEIALQKQPHHLVALEKVSARLTMALDRGAVAINTANDDYVNEALVYSDGRGFDKVIEVVGSPESLQAAIDLVRPGGTIAAIGVFSTQSFNLNLSDVFLRDISLHMNGFANVQPFMQGAADLLQSGKVHADDLFTHDFKLRDIDKAYVMFDQQSDGVSKVLIRP